MEPFVDICVAVTVHREVNHNQWHTAFGMCFDDPLDELDIRDTAVALIVNNCRTRHLHSPHDKKVGRLSFRSGGIVDMSGGSIGEDLQVTYRGAVSLSGGRTVTSDSSIGISGGAVGCQFYSRGNLTISGGTFSEIDVAHGSYVHLIGKEFLVNRMPLEGVVDPGRRQGLCLRGAVLV